MEKGSEQEIYTACKRRNQESIQRIKDLESQIASLELEIQEKKQRASCLYAYRHKCAQLVQRKTVYSTLLKQIAKNDRIDPIEEQRRQHKREDSLSASRHDVDSLCRSLGQFILGHSDSSKDRIRLDIERMMQQETPKDVLSCIIRTIRDQRLDQQRLEIDNSLWKEKLQNVERTHLARNLQLKRAERSSLERRATQVQLQLKARVRQLYPDVEVQQAVLKCAYAKAASQEAAAQLQAIDSYVKKLEAEIKSYHSIENDLTKQQAETEAAVSLAAKKLERVKRLLATNRQCRLELDGRRKMILDKERKRTESLLNDLTTVRDALLGSIRRNVDAFHETPLTPNTCLSNPPENARLEQIKQTLNPNFTMSREGAICALADAICRVNSHAIDFPAGQDKPDLRKDIETIVTKWQNDLHEAGSSMELSTAHRDGIDALVQLVDAALDHAQTQEKHFIHSQEQEIQSKLRQLKQLDKQIVQLMNIIEERQIIQDGSLGVDYTLQEKTLQEWISTLKNAEQ